MYYRFSPPTATPTTFFATPISCIFDCVCEHNVQLCINQADGYVSCVHCTIVALALRACARACRALRRIARVRRPAGSCIAYTRTRTRRACNCVITSHHTQSERACASAAPLVASRRRTCLAVSDGAACRMSDEDEQQPAQRRRFEEPMHSAASRAMSAIVHRSSMRKRETTV